MLWLTHYINFTQTTQLAAAPSPAIAVDSIVFVGSFRLILYTNSLRQNRNRNRNRNRKNKGRTGHNLGTGTRTDRFALGLELKIQPSIKLNKYRVWKTTSTDLKRCMDLWEEGDEVVGQHGEADDLEESVMAPSFRGEADCTIARTN